MWICILNLEFFFSYNSRSYLDLDPIPVAKNALFLLVPDGLYTPDWVLTVAIPYILSGYTLLFPFEHPVLNGLHLLFPAMFT